MTTSTDQQKLNKWRAYYFAHVIPTFIDCYKRSEDGVKIDSIKGHEIVSSQFTTGAHKKVLEKFSYTEVVEVDDKNNIIITKTTISTTDMNLKELIDYIRDVEKWCNQMYGSYESNYAPFPRSFDLDLQEEFKN